MGKVRRCGARYHNAKKPRCKCWCGGHFHGAQGATNREAFVDTMAAYIEHQGYKTDEVKYIPNQQLALELS